MDAAGRLLRRPVSGLGETGLRGRVSPRRGSSCGESRPPAGRCSPLGGAWSRQVALAACLALAATASPAAAEETAPECAPPLVREIFVPFEDLHVLLEADAHRVFLGTNEYRELLEKARQRPAAERAPLGAVLLSADYRVAVETGRAAIEGTVEVDVLHEGLHALPLTLGGVGVRTASLDGSPAAIGVGEGGQATLFVQGSGRRQLRLDMVAPIATSAAQQSLDLRLPAPAATRLSVTVPGNVEIKSGAAVISRALDAEAEVTRFELLMPQDRLNLVMSLNNRILQQQRAVIARCVVIDEITTAYERLHATLSWHVLHGAATEFRVALPQGFEPTEVTSPLLSRWEVVQDQGQPVLLIVLREPAESVVVAHLSAERTAARPDPWTVPRLTLVDVSGQVAVIGLVVEDRLAVESLQQEGLIPLDLAVLSAALPPGVLAAEPGAPRVRPVAAFYAPQPEFRIDATFALPSARFQATTNLLLAIRETGHEVQGGFALAPEIEKLFAVRFLVPEGWDVTEVTASDGTPLAFERISDLELGTLLRTRLPQGVPPGQVASLSFRAVRVPAGWLGAWDEQPVAFPRFAVLDAALDRGAIAIRAEGDLAVRPDQLADLTPLDDRDKANYGMAGVSSNLAYRYERQPYAATLRVSRVPPWITARSFSFLQVSPEGLAAHYEVFYDVQRAGARQLLLNLPLDTPKSLAIRGLDGLAVKEFHSEEQDSRRRWRVLLAEPARGVVRLAVDFQQPLPEGDVTDYALPLVAAEGVAYQSSVVAVEGHPELDVDVECAARRVDVGELVAADYAVGRRLLGVFGSAGAGEPVLVSVRRRDGYPLPVALVQRARLETALAASGEAQTSARFELRTKASFLEVRLPADSQLWSVYLDGSPVAPQRDGDRLLLSLPAANRPELRDLQVVYQTRLSPLGVSGDVRTEAPALLVRMEGESASREVPVADLAWTLILPPGHRLIDSRGTVFPDELPQPTSPVVNVAAACLGWLGGMQSPIQSARESARRAANSEYSYNVAPPTSAPAATDEGVDSAGRYGDDYGSAYGSAAMPGGAEMGSQPTGAAEAMPQIDSSGPGLEIGKPMMPAELAAEDPFALPAPMDQPAAPGEPPLAAARPAAVPQEGEEFDREQLEGVREEKPAWERDTVRSLKIDLQQVGDRVNFRGLGVRPRLDVTLVDDRRVEFLAWSVAAGLLALGLLLTRRSGGLQVRYVLAVGFLALLLPTILGQPHAYGPVFDFAFYAVCLLVPCYAAVALWRWLAGRPVPSRTRVARVAGLVLAATMAAEQTAWSQEPPAAPAAAGAAPGAAAAELAFPAPSAASPAAGPTGVSPAAELPAGVAPATIDLEALQDCLAPLPPIRVPDDAVIIPYEGLDTAATSRVLVPYTRYVELWNRAFPDRQLEAAPPIVDFALAGAAYRAVLAAEDTLVVQGHVDLEVFVDKPLEIPLGLEGGVLADARVDGAPARLRLALPAAPPTQSTPAAAQGEQAMVQQQAANPAQQAVVQPRSLPAAAPSLVLLQVAGRGRKRLELTIHLPLERRGGWRVVAGRIPAAPATSLTLSMPAARTDVRLGSGLDRAEFETEAENQEWATPLAADGRLQLQWRTKGAETQVDRSLTVRSEAVLDVQEDGLRLAWQLGLEFPRHRRDAFTLEVPADLLVEKVLGENVRTWNTESQDGKQRIDVVLLNEAADRETMTLQMSRRMSLAAGGEVQFPAPYVSVTGASLQRGRLTVRRSPWLEVRAVPTAGVARTDVPEQAVAALMGPWADTESPLGMRAFQAYSFDATPLSIELYAAAISSDTTARLQTLLRIAERETRVEVRILIEDRRRPVHRVRLLVPPALEIERLDAPGEFQWSQSLDDDGRHVNVFLADGQPEAFAVDLRGSLGRREAADPVPLPSLVVLDAARQEGELVVQIDPAYDVRVGQQQDCEVMLLSQVFGWLQPEQRQTARLALRVRGADYAARLDVQRRQPRVTGVAITNVKLTDIAIEETIILDWNIEGAGISQLEFRLPQDRQQARLQVPLLRQQTVEDVGDGWVRYRLELQDEILGQFRVLIENDRALPEAVDGKSAVQAAPIPVLETGRTAARYVTLENAARDEVAVVDQQGLLPLSRQQSEWKTLASILGEGITTAFLVQGDAEHPLLGFETRQRRTVATAGAAIGLGETVLIVDSSGAYRGQQTYHVSNTTEQFLQIQLPDGAALWSAVIAGEPVKPAPVEPLSQGQVRIPLIKTAEGDRDYPMVLKYGGAMATPMVNLRAVSFPLIRTMNIHVERSQVRLRLPETYRWFDFGGSMRRVLDRAEYQADYFDYNLGQMKRLMQAWNSDNPYAKVRVANNLKQLNEALRSYEAANSELVASRSFQSRFQANTGFAQQATEQTFEFLDQEAGLPDEDNRRRLNVFYDQQRSGLASNVVTDLASNFAGRELVDKKAAVDSKFNIDWFARNQLQSDSEESAQQLKSRFTKGVERHDLGDKLKAYTQDNALVPQRGKDGAKEIDAVDESRLAQQRDSSAASLGQQQSQQSLTREYRERLSQQAPQSGRLAGQAAGDYDFADMAQAQSARRGSPITSFGAIRGDLAVGESLEEMGGMGGGAGVAGPPALGQDPASPTADGYLASLDVELPERGQEFFFTTPRGEIEITARALSNRLIDRLLRGLAVVAGLVVLTVAFRLVAWIAGRFSGSPWFAGTLVLVGLFSLLAGILPVLGIVLITLGIIQLVRVFRSRPAGAAAV